MGALRARMKCRFLRIALGEKSGVPCTHLTHDGSGVATTGTGGHRTNKRTSDADHIGVMVALPRDGVKTEFLQTEVLHPRHCWSWDIIIASTQYAEYLDRQMRLEKMGNIELLHPALAARRVA